MNEFNISGAVLALLSLSLRWLFPTVPRPVALAGVAAGLIILLSSFLMPQLKYSLLAFSTFTVGLCMIGYAVHLVWPSAQNGSKPPNAVAIERNSDLLLECDAGNLPAVGAENETAIMYIQPIRWGSEPSYGIGKIPTQPNQPINWPDEWKNKFASISRCTVTNYGTSTLFNLQLEIEMDFYNLVRKDTNSIGSDRLVGTAKAIFSITRIEPGRNSRYSFYFVNQSLDVVRLRFAKSATYYSSIARAREQIPLIQSETVSETQALWPLREAADIVEEQVRAQKNQGKSGDDH